MVDYTVKINARTQTLLGVWCVPSCSVSAGQKRLTLSFPANARNRRYLHQKMDKARVDRQSENYPPAPLFQD